jgi:hypothetical protein
MSELSFEPLNLTEINKEADRLNKTNTGLNDTYIKMPDKEGFLNIRLLPKIKGKDLFCSTRIHYINGKSLHCTRTIVDGKWVVDSSRGECPCCKKYNALWQEAKITGDPNERSKIENKARSLKPVERYFWNAIVRSENNPKTGAVDKNVGPKILAIGKTVQTLILESIRGSEMIGKAALGDVTDPFKGRDFKLIKKVVRGSGGAEYPNYDHSIFLDPCPAGTTEELKKWLHSIHDLSECRKIPAREELEVEVRKFVNPNIGDEDDEPVSYTAKKESQPVTKSPKEEVKTKADIDPELAGMVDEDFLKSFQSL